MEEFQIVRIRAKVKELEGELAIHIYTADKKHFRIWYNPKDEVALYARVEWDEKLERDRNVKAWASQILREINAKGTRIEVTHRNGKKHEVWFGPDRDMKPVSAVFEYVMSFEKAPSKGLKDYVHEKDGNAHGADKKQPNGNGHKPEALAKKSP